MWYDRYAAPHAKVVVGPKGDRVLIYTERWVGVVTQNEGVVSTLETPQPIKTIAWHGHFYAVLHDGELAVYLAQWSHLVGTLVCRELKHCLDIVSISPTLLECQGPMDFVKITTTYAMAEIFEQILSAACRDANCFDSTVRCRLTLFQSFGLTRGEVLDTLTQLRGCTIGVNNKIVIFDFTKPSAVVRDRAIALINHIH